MTEKFDTQHVIVTGNPLDGITIFGPFTDFDDAEEVVSRFDDTDWWITPLHQFDEVAR